MNFLKKVIAGVKDAKDLHQRRSQLRELMLSAVSDGKLSDEEIKDIEIHCDELGLPRDEIANIRMEVFETALRAVKADRRLTDVEMTDLVKIMNYFQIPKEGLDRSQAELSRYRLLYEIDQGHLPVISPGNVMLRKEERTHWVEPATMIEERVIKSTYSGGSSGTSFRIAKGVRFRVGSHRGTIKSERGYVPVSTGTLIITNKRIVFAGDRKSTNVSVEKLSDVTPYSDALVFTQINKTKPVVLRVNPGNMEVVSAILSSLMNDSS